MYEKANFLESWKDLLCEEPCRHPRVWMSSGHGWKQITSTCSPLHVSILSRSTETTQHAMESAPHRSSQPTQPTRRRICEEAEAQVVQQRLGLASKTETPQEMILAEMWRGHTDETTAAAQVFLGRDTDGPRKLNGTTAPLQRHEVSETELAWKWKAIFWLVFGKSFLSFRDHAIQSHGTWRGVLDHVGRPSSTPHATRHADVPLGAPGFA